MLIEELDMKVIKNWVICGPFPYGNLLSEAFESFYVDYLESIGGESRAVLKPGLSINEAKCTEILVGEDGYIDFVKIYGEFFEKFWRLKYGVAYAYTEIEVEKENTYVFLIGSEDYITIYVNGEHLFTSHIAKKYSDSYYAVPVKLMRGNNKVLVKVGRLAGKWGFSLKLDYTNVPVYVNRERNILPEPPRGLHVAEWIGLQVLALRDVKFKVKCVENEMWYPCESELVMLYAGERVQIPLFIMSKKPLESSSVLRVIFEIEDFGEYTLDLEIKPSSELLHRVHTYRSKYDGSVHRYGVKIPVNYDSSKKYPVVIILHGFKGISMYTFVYGDKDWCISIAPTARDGEVNYREIGLLEVLEVLEDVKKRYLIDEDRVHLTGHSMGGYGAWYIGVKRPDIFASIAPHSSRGNLINTVKALLRYPGWEGVAKLVDKYNPAVYVKNLIETPVYIAHGSEDNIVPVEYSREMSRLLDLLGYKYVYEEIKGKQHWWGVYNPGSYYGAEAIDRPQLDDFLKSIKRKYPKRVIAVVDDIRFNKYWWITIRALTYEEIGYVDVEILGPHDVRVNALRGVAGFSLNFEDLCSRGILDCKRSVSVFVDNSVIRLPPQVLLRDLIFLVEDSKRFCARSGDFEICSSGELRVGVSRSRRKLNKNVLSGPFMDVFNGRVAVVPCSDQKFRDVCFKAALHLQYWWLDYANGIIKLYSDREFLSYNLHGEYNVIAIGGPEINKYVELVSSDIKPVRINGECIVVRGKKYCGKEFGVAFIYPNSLVEFEKYIAVIGSNTWDPVLAAMRLEYTLIPDYIVYNSKSIGVKLEGVVESGFFDVNWE